MANIDVNTPSEDAAPETTVTPTPETVAPTPTVEATPAPAEPTPAPVTLDEAKPAVSTVAPKAKKSKGNLVHFVIEGILIVLVIGLAFWGMGQASAKKDAQAALASAKANPQALVQSQTDALIKKVSLLMTLPTGETPTVAEVSDATAAKAQSAFFVNAQNGDKVLMYAKSGQAILYRPSTNKIILVAPLTFNK